MGWVVSNYLATGKAPVPMGNENMTAAPSGTFATGEGLLNIAANEQKQFEALCAAIGKPALIADARFAARETRKENRYALKREIEAGLKPGSAAEWEAILNEAGVPAGQVLSVPQILDHQQVKGRDFVVSIVDVPGLGKPTHVSRGGFRVNGEGAKPSAPPPALGAQTDAWLRKLGYDIADIARLRAQKTV